MMDSSSWTVSDHSLHPAGDDDFQHFMDMNVMGGLGDGLNYDFQDFQSSSREHMDTPMSGTDAPMILSRTDSVLHRQMPAITTAASYQSIPTTMIPPPSPTGAIVDSIDAQIQFLQQQKLQHQQRQLEEQRVAFYHQMVPPTPRSLEIQAGTNQFYVQPNRTEQQQQQHHQQHQHQQHQQQQQQQALEYRYLRLKDQQDMSFTPLVSPAVTPLETHFPVDNQFTVPGAYFSPLTSPALHAQNDSLAVYDQNLGQLPASSPREMDLETPTPPVANSAPGDLAKKVRKNAAKARGKAGIKQSPISKPMRRRTATTPNMNALVLSELAENIDQSQDRSHQLPTPMLHTSASSTTGATDSENGSISPEALNDMVSPVEMPPPPIPKSRSARPSPYIAPQNKAVSSPLQIARPGAPSPATPASLMKLSSPNNRASAVRAGSQEPIDTDHIESFELPESANFTKANYASVDVLTALPPAAEASPIKMAGPLSLPSPVFMQSTATVSASQSPQLTPKLSAGLRKTPQLMPRNNKKRASVSSVHVSPALRPKISPNIKPLLPGGATAEDTASHLLATKSNYQRILEGNTVPGVSYPSELSTGLTSKRTSHKLAEQGRRNRINSALQEIATLLPRVPKDAKETKGSEGDGDDGKEKAGSIPNSKASTVELAIEYIKQLQKEVAEANRRAEEAEKKLEPKMAD